MFKYRLKWFGFCKSFQGGHLTFRTVNSAVNQGAPDPVVLCNGTKSSQFRNQFQIWWNWNGTSSISHKVELCGTELRFWRKSSSSIFPIFHIYFQFNLPRFISKKRKILRNLYSYKQCLGFILMKKKFANKIISFLTSELFQNLWNFYPMACTGTKTERNQLLFHHWNL